MDQLKCLRLSILTEARDHIRLPSYQGGALRGAFGFALKKTACTFKDQPCSGCLLKERCVYSYVFETPPPADAEVMRLYPHAPHPFVINPMTEGEGEHLPGNQLRFGMTLVGKAVEYLPYFIYAFVLMGEGGLGKGRGRFSLSTIHALDERGEKTEIIFENDFIKPPETMLDYSKALRLAESYDPEKITVVFKTPLRVKYRGRLTDKPEFHVLVRVLLRRISNMLYFHCGQRIELPFKELIERAESVRTVEEATGWFDWNRFSMRQKDRMKMGGIVGRATYRGDLSPFLPMLVVGSWLNIGKGTTFGLGSYRLVRNMVVDGEMGS